MKFDRYFICASILAIKKDREQWMGNLLKYLVFPNCNMAIPTASNQQIFRLGDTRSADYARMPLQCQVANPTFGDPYSHSSIARTGDNPLPGKNLTEPTESCGLIQHVGQRGTKKRTVCPKNLRIFTKLRGSKPVPSEDISYYSMVPSLFTLNNPLPSGVNSMELTAAICPCHFATSLCLGESHIQSEAPKSPPATLPSIGPECDRVKPEGPPGYRHNIRRSIS